MLGRVRAVIVDEVHAFAGDDRGWHLLAVLERLERLTGHHIQRIGLSATVGNPDTLLTWLQGASPADRRGQVVAPGVTLPATTGTATAGSGDLPRPAGEVGAALCSPPIAASHGRLLWNVVSRRRLGIPHAAEAPAAVAGLAEHPSRTAHTMQEPRSDSPDRGSAR